MNLRRLVIRNFRGIAALDWSPEGGLQALVGAGDSCKTTILEAAELALSPRWNPIITDNDFYTANTNLALLIEATIGDLPSSLKSERKFGLNLRGMNQDGEIHDEPAPGDDPVLTICFAVDSDLEPTWEVVNDRLVEPKFISARDRAEFGVSRLYDQTNQHFTWGRGSALLESMSTPEHVGRLLAEAQRTLRIAAADMEFAVLDDAVEAARGIAIEMGAGHVADHLLVSLNADGVGARGTGISLHVDGIPLDRNGLGTRRLVALGLQHLAVREGAIMLVDEIESGLEPHRVRHLLQKLREFVAPDPSSSGGGGRGQVLLTTHSAVALEELEAEQVNVVHRSRDGVVTVRRASTELQAVIRSNPESFLAKRVLVCEGKTELGLVRAMDRWWRSNDPRLAMPHVGAVMAYGNGSQTGDRARLIASLGFPVAILADSDRPLVPSADVLIKEGIRVLTWDDSMATEQRLIADAPWDAFVEFATFAISERSLDAVRTAVEGPLGRSLTGGVADWAEDDEERSQLMRAFADASKLQGQGWFKRVDSGDFLGTVVAKYWSTIEYTPTGQVLTALHEWICSDDDS